MNFLVFFFYIFVMRPGHKRGGFREVVPLVLWYVGIPILSISWVFLSMQETACHCISMMWRIVGDWVPSLRTIICIHYINPEARGWNPGSFFHWGEYNCILDGIMEKVCNPTPSHLVLNGRGRTGKTNNTTSAAGVMAVVLSIERGFAFTRQRIVWLCNRVGYVMIQKATGKQWRCVRGYSFSIGTALLRVHFSMGAAAARL